LFLAYGILEETQTGSRPEELGNELGGTGVSPVSLLKNTGETPVP